MNTMLPDEGLARTLRSDDCAAMWWRDGELWLYVAIDTRTGHLVRSPPCHAWMLPAVHQAATTGWPPFEKQYDWPDRQVAYVLALLEELQPQRIH